MTPEQLAGEIARAADGDPVKASGMLMRIIRSKREDGPQLMERKTAFCDATLWIVTVFGEVDGSGGPDIFRGRKTVICYWCQNGKWGTSTFGFTDEPYPRLI